MATKERKVPTAVDVANEIAAENERLKRQEEAPNYGALLRRFGKEAADKIVAERVEWIDLSAELLSAAQGVLHAWEQSEKHNASNIGLWLSGPIGELYGAVMDMNRKADELEATSRHLETCYANR